MKRLLKHIDRLDGYRTRKLTSGGISLILLWPVLQWILVKWPLQGIPYQGYAPYLAFAGIVGLIIGLIIFLIVILPLLLWLRRRRRKTSLATPQPDQAPTIPVVAPGQDKTQPGVSIADAETVETLSPLAVEEPATVPISGQRPTQICWQIAGLTDVGLKRELNEDNLLMLEAETPEVGPYGLYAVADGMGGHEKGEVASQLTLNALQEKFNQHSLTSANTPFDDWLTAAALAANENVLARQKPDGQDKKMGSTLVMALVIGQQAHIANIGDSRAYHLNSEGIEQVTEDHSLVERLVQIGQISREEARVHRQRNVIYNTIGDKSDPQVSLYDITLQPGDRLLLCSDGLSGMITDDEILNISRSHPSPVAACKKMVEAAKSAGGVDNITVIVIQMA